MRKSRFTEEEIHRRAEGAPGRVAGGGAVPQARDQRRGVLYVAIAVWRREGVRRQAVEGSLGRFWLFDTLRAEFSTRGNREFIKSTEPLLAIQCAPNVGDDGVSNASIAGCQAPTKGVNSSSSRSLSCCAASRTRSMSGAYERPALRAAECVSNAPQITFSARSIRESWAALANSNILSVISNAVGTPAG
jgi:hypothetical protein